MTWNSEFWNPEGIRGYRLIQSYRSNQEEDAAEERQTDAAEERQTDAAEERQTEVILKCF